MYAVLGVLGGTPRREVATTEETSASTSVATSAFRSQGPAGRQSAHFSIIRHCHSFLVQRSATTGLTPNGRDTTSLTPKGRDPALAIWPPRSNQLLGLLIGLATGHGTSVSAVIGVTTGRRRDGPNCPL